MRHLYLSAAVMIAVLVAVLASGIFAAHAFDDLPYPDWKGQWSRTAQKFPGQPSYDGDKPQGRGQQAPLTAEYQAVYDANEADQRAGGFGNTTGWWCNAWGMPAMMNVFQPMEIVITPAVTYMLTSDTQFTVRRIFTDRRDWPAEIEPSYRGFSLGRWRDVAGSGRYDTLLVETRGPFKGPRVYDASGVPLHADNQSIITERLSLDRSNHGILHDEITVIDHALTRPWTVTKSYAREGDPRAPWGEYVCEDGQSHVRVGGESYYLSADGLLMPTKKDQAPPDLRYFGAAKPQAKQQ